MVLLLLFKFTKESISLLDCCKPASLSLERRPFVPTSTCSLAKPVPGPQTPCHPDCNGAWPEAFECQPEEPNVYPPDTWKNPLVSFVLFIKIFLSSLSSWIKAAYRFSCVSLTGMNGAAQKIALAEIKIGVKSEGVQHWPASCIATLAGLLYLLKEDF